MYDHVEIDLQPLKALETAIGKEKANNYLHRFLEDCPQKIKEINDAFTKSDFTLVQHITHTLASSSATFGATDLHHQCRKIEDDCGVGKVSNLKEDIEQLTAMGDVSCTRLKELA